MAYLRYLDDSGRLESKHLDAEQFVIGRAGTCQLALESEMISREHLRIDLEADGRYRARDLGSRNKTFVNGELITETLLTSGDIIRVGDRILEFVDEVGKAESVELDFLVADRTDPPDCEWVKLRATLNLTVPQVEQIAQLCPDLALTARAEDIANAAIGQIILDTQAERGFIALRGEGKTELRPIAQRAFKKGPGATLVGASQNFVLAPVLQGVGGRYPMTAQQLSSKLSYAATGLVAPMTFRGEVVGVIYLDRPAAKKPFPPAALQYVMGAGAHLGALIGETARRLTRMAVREGAAWMSAIRRVQAAISTPVTSSDTFEASLKIFPGRFRCGDFGSVFHVDDQRCVMVVLDAGGHGMSGLVQAAAILGAVRTALQTAPETVMDPSNLFQAVNQMVAESASRQVIPCTFVGLDTSAGRLSYVNAGGANPVVLLAPGRLLSLEQPSLVLGVDKDYLYEPTRVELPNSFRVICFSTGLVGAVSAGGEVVGEQRIHEALTAREAFSSAADLVARVGNVWATHLAATQADDDALVLAVACGGAGA